MVVLTSLHFEATAQYTDGNGGVYHPWTDTSTWYDNPPVYAPCRFSSIKTVTKVSYANETHIYYEFEEAFNGIPTFYLDGVATVVSYCFQTPSLLAISIPPSSITYNVGYDHKCDVDYSALFYFDFG